MNRLILRFATPATVLILVIFTWVVINRVVDGGPHAVVVLAVTAVVVWIVGTIALVYFWPRITVNGFRRMFTKRGLGDGPIPVNALHAVLESPSQSAAVGSVVATGADDLVYLGSWLDLREGPLVLRVPDMAGRYYSLQLTDPASGANFAYVGTRTTGTGEGGFLLCERPWAGATPAGLSRIDLPHRSALVIGRVFAADDADRAVAYELAQQIRLQRISS